MKRLISRLLKPAHLLLSMQLVAIPLLGAGQPGYQIEIITHGEEHPRSINDSAERMQDNRRVDVSLSGQVSVELPNGGVIWSSVDPGVMDLRLEVTAANTVEVKEGRFGQPLQFSLYSNYRDYIERWELQVYRSSDPDRTDPLKVFTGSGEDIRFDEKLSWDGSVEHSAELKAGEELEYLLIAYDADGNRDETWPRLVHIVSGDLDSIGVERRDQRSGYGLNNLSRQQIAVNGDRFRLHGADIPTSSQLEINGERIELDVSGKFVIESYLKPGQHEFAVLVKDPATDLVWERRLIAEAGSEPYFFMVGIADVTIGENRVSGSSEALAVDDHYNGDIFVDGRLAFYLKSKLENRYRITAQLDTKEDELKEIFKNIHRKDAQSVFRRLDPDRYYATYGDESTTTKDTDSQGRFYVRGEWDKNQALWGTYNTGITGSEYASYNRSLYGARLHLRSRSATEYGDNSGELTLFGAEAQSALGHNEFIGTGGSLYYLRHTDILVGSEKVSVEIRERSSGRAVKHILLERGRDYEIDDLQGRIILSRPLQQVSDVSGPSIIKDALLDGNDVYLLVDYEYRPSGFSADRITAGGRGKVWLNDHVGLGATYVDESRAAEEHQLAGVDVTLRYGRGTYIKGEYARTEGRQSLSSFLSEDGGLSFSEIRDPASSSAEGSAYGVEARVNLSEVSEHDGELAAWWKREDSGFSTTRSDSGRDREHYGVEGRWQASSDLQLIGRADVVEQRAASRQSELSVQGDLRTGSAWTLSAQLRQQTDEDLQSGTQAQKSDLGLKAQYSITPDTQVYGIVQKTIAGAEQKESELYTLGVRSRPWREVGLTAEVSSGESGTGGKAGIDWNINNQYSLYGTYTLSSDRTDGDRGVTTVGGRARISNQLNVYNENQHTHSDRQSGIAHVFGLDYQPAEQWRLSGSLQSSELEDASSGLIERDALSLGLTNSGDRRNWQAKVEYRRDRGDSPKRQWLLSSRYDYKLNPDYTLLSKLNLSWSEDRAMAGIDDARFAEFNLGLAYRPVAHDRFNLLGKYSYLYDLDSIGQSSDPDERGHVLSLEGIYELGHRWNVGGKLAWKRSEIRASRDSGDWFGSNTYLGVVRTRYHLTHRWDGLIEYRYLLVDEAEDNRGGFLIALSRHIGDHFKLGIGYNFTQFNDDLTALDYDNKGWFISLLGKY